MRAFTHIAAGALSAVLLSKGLHATQVSFVMLVAGGVLGSMLPDIDHPESAFGRRVLPLSLTLSALFGHRGVTHSLVAVGLMAWLSWVALHGAIGWAPAMTTPFVLGIAAGYLSHLLCDFFTNSGVPLLWPMKRKFASPVRFNTGSSLEYLLAGGLYFAAFAVGQS